MVRVTGGVTNRSAGRADRRQAGLPAPAVYQVHRRRRSRDDQRKGFTEAENAPLLDDARQRLGGPLVVVWDGLNTHVSRAMADLVTTRSWLTVFRLPPYAHELDPVDRSGRYLKRSLANLAKRDIGQLTALVKTQLRRMQYRPGLLDGFLAGQARPHTLP